MCGLAGIWSADPPCARPELEARLGAMAAMLRHRGPDDSGFWTDGAVGLAHTRLAVIDLSPTGHQPMTDEGERAVLVYNGEVYNFAELRAELAAAGEVFRGASDSEVLLRGYLRWGEGVVARLRGMFAFALWDRTRRRLLLARDRLGKKPLAYAWHEGRLLFASEIKAILAWPSFRRAARAETLDAYLAYQAVPAPATAFAGIEKLPPAHYAVVENGRLALTRYWQAPPPATATRAGDGAEFLALLDDAVKARLVADVPVGAFLSGGVDSAAVVASMARVASGRVRTFTVGFADSGFDERAEAREVADCFATAHQDYLVTPDAAALVPFAVWHYGEPFADASAIPSLIVAEIARREVTVVLNGDGGDEALMGYPVYRACRASGQLDALPASLRRVIAATGRALPFARSSAGAMRRAQRFAMSADQPRHRRYVDWIATFDAGERADLLTEAALADAADRLAPCFEGDAPMEAEAAACDVANYLPDVLLTKVDIATMAHSLEARSPLLDHRVIEYALSVDPTRRLAGGRTKAFFKDALKARLPEAVLDRPKRGFAVPLDRWFRGPLKEMLADTLLSAAVKARGLLRLDRVERLIQGHLSGGENHGNRLWSLLMLELWFRAWIDGASLPARPRLAPAVVHG